jgi:hypothetical protein
MTMFDISKTAIVYALGFAMIAIIALNGVL